MTKALHTPQSINTVADLLGEASTRCRKAAKRMQDLGVPRVELNYEVARSTCIKMSNQWVGHIENVLDEMALSARAGLPFAIPREPEAHQSAAVVTGEKPKRVRRTK